MSGRSFWVMSLCVGLLLLPRPASAQIKPDLSFTGATVPNSGSVTAPVLDAGVDASDGAVEAGADAFGADLLLPDGAGAEAGGDTSVVDTGQEGGADAVSDIGPEEGGKEGWYWPDLALEGGTKAPDAAEKPGPPITAMGCDCDTGQGPTGAAVVALVLTFALVIRVRITRRRRT